MIGPLAQEEVAPPILGAQALLSHRSSNDETLGSFSIQLCRFAWLFTGVANQIRNYDRRATSRRLQGISLRGQWGKADGAWRRRGQEFESHRRLGGARTSRGCRTSES